MTSDEMRDALIQTGHELFLKRLGDHADLALAEFVARVEDFQEEYQRRFGERPNPLLLLKDSPPKAAAFFEPDTLMASPPMQVLIWRILLGCHIVAVNVNYERGGATSLLIRLETPFGEAEEYSGEPVDLRVLRHFGISGRGEGERDAVILGGYYAIQRPRHN
jgi:hypothetical protein